MIRLDLGAGAVSPPGFIPMGNAHGTPIYPLNVRDGTVDVIRAAHCLEHFPHGQIGDVLADWVRALRPGGTLKIAVPDFAKIAENYLAGAQQPTEGYIMGGQTAHDDFHKAIFDRDRLRKLLADAGLVLLRPWTSEIDDCAGYPISLNLEGRKPHKSEIKVSGVMSVPRLGFMDNFFSCVEACVPCNVKLRKHGGAFWGQSLTKVIERVLAEDDADYVCAIDYDSIFTPKHLATLMQLAMVYPEIDALAAIQSSRHEKTTLFTVHGKDGDNAPVLPRSALEGDTTPVATAHFGLTLISTQGLRRMSKPWFHSVPSAQDDWGDGHVDEDIQFWRRWEAAGLSLHLASRVAIGHLEVMARWPDVNLEVFYQPMSDYHANGVPEETWR